MRELPNVTIVMGRCEKSRQAFGIRFEEISPGKWVGDWAFALKDKAPKKEGYELNTIKGTIEFGPAYPGCPYCEDGNSIFQCHACGGKINCWDGIRKTVTCAWCGSTGTIGGIIESLGGIGDR